jgi:GDPmannose 4,6-dehydratase
MKALITGITGQDGSYLAELLLRQDYEVHGTVRRASLPNLGRVKHIADDLHLHWGDLTDGSTLARTFSEVEPDEVYNIAALSDVRVSFGTPEFSGNVTGLGATRVLELTRLINPDARFYQAGSSEMFGMNPDVPTNERSAFYPASPYAAAKVYAHHMTVNYRESYDLHASNGILFNHESERRGHEFVTRKITLAIADIVRGDRKELVLGNLDASRDWGHAEDYVDAMHRIVSADQPDDYVIATGETYTIRQFLDAAFGLVGRNWHDFVTTDARYFRPVDPPVLLGDATKARTKLDWEPKVKFHELVWRMVENDLKEWRA